MSDIAENQRRSLDILPGREDGAAPVTGETSAAGETDHMVDESVVELEVDRIQRLAATWGVTPILVREDLVTQQPAMSLQAWLRDSADGKLCIMEDGSIITADPDAPQVEAARALMGLKRIPFQVRPAMSEVVRAALRRLDEDEIGDDMLIEDDRTETDVSRLFLSILDAAVNREASDIHFEMRGSEASIRFRVNGQMIEYDRISARETIAIGNYLFNAEAKRGALQFNTYMPLNASAQFPVRGQTVATRFATAPDIRGVDIFVRIWRPDAEAWPLEDLGYTRLQRDLLREAFGRPYGVIVFSGPTGSGKSTSMSAVLETLPESLKVVSLEEPVERELPNVTHIAISDITDHGGWENLRGGLNRWDSNINVLGEIKDRETADSIKDLVTAGKLTITTLHASNVLTVPSRMEDLGVDHSLLCDPNFLVLLINQRLVPELCRACKTPFTEAEHVDRDSRHRFSRLFAEEMERVFVRGSGCAECSNSGIVGRLLAAEMVMIDETSLDFIRNRDPLRWRQHLSAHGWRPITDHMLRHVRAGRVDPVDAERAAGRLDATQTPVFDYRERAELVDDEAEEADA
ncbi:MAG: ATPase, T2SS/T4P/T4SS family [Gammaproteobacteria bacterium]|nr:ATPase, T2SS/T4P/T4SS family [Gammaproteobacteria bacterium]